MRTFARLIQIQHSQKQKVMWSWLPSWSPPAYAVRPEPIMFELMLPLTGGQGKVMPDL